MSAVYAVVQTVSAVVQAVSAVVQAVSAVVQAVSAVVQTVSAVVQAVSAVVQAVSAVVQAVSAVVQTVSAVVQAVYAGEPMPPGLPCGHVPVCDTCTVAVSTNSHPPKTNSCYSHHTPKIVGLCKLDNLAPTSRTQGSLPQQSRAAHPLHSMHPFQLS